MHKSIAVQIIDDQSVQDFLVAALHEYVRFNPHISAGDILIAVENIRHDMTEKVIAASRGVPVRQTPFRPDLRLG